MRFSPYLFALLLLLPVLNSNAQVVSPQQIKPMASHGELLGSVPPLRDLVPITQPQETEAKEADAWSRPNYFPTNALNNADPLPRHGDPLVNRKTSGAESSNPELTPGLNFEGLNDGGVVPPDPTGDVGKDHYMQMINSGGNSWLQIWDKQGQSVYGPALSSTIWSQVGTGSIGDPIVQYDAAAQRWLIMEMQGFGNSELLLAISDNSDPTGGWKAYRFSTLGFPDYPKLYIWPDAYLITVNEIVGGNKCAGYALNRADILAGADQFGLYRFEMPNFLGIQYQPATGVDWEGGPPPPPGSPGYIFRVYDDAWNGGVDQLQYWEVHLNWQDVNSSFLDGPHQLFPAPFETRVCWSGLFDCIEQPGASSPRITALENIIMYRIPYRNFGDHESIVLNHVTDVSDVVGPGGDAAIRWYELRKTPGTEWSIYQQGTSSPDLTNRIMSTLSMDESGNIGLGYTAVSTSVYPGIRITGRRAGDPLNEMTLEEYTLKEGAASSSTQRWGDYSNMAVDPVDGRTFWYTSEYMPAQGMSATRIGSFTIQRDTFDVTPEKLLAPVLNTLTGAAEQVTVQVFNSGILPAWNIPLTLKFDGQIVSNEVLTDTIQPGASAAFTFTPTIAMTVPGKLYPIEIYDSWAPDGFDKNDTLRVDFRRPTENDAAFGGRLHLPGLVCSSEHTFDYLLRNASGLPMTSATIRQRLNTQSWQAIPWTGNLAPGAIDTVPLTLTGINDGLNTLRIITDLPNGSSDQNIHNDSMFVKFYGNLSGAFVTLECNTDVGVLHWEVRDPNNAITANGDFTGGTQYENICTANGVCYTLSVKSKTLSWDGHLVLYDLFGNAMVQVEHASPEEKVFQFCTPVRKPVDVGARALLAPATSGNLGSTEPVQMVVRNFGTTTQQNIQASWRLGSGNWNTETVPVPLLAGDTLHYTFNGSTADLSALGDYTIGLKATVNADAATGNDSIAVLVSHLAQLDASLLPLHLIEACSDTAAVLLGLDVRNNGLSAIDSFRVQINCNGTLQVLAHHDVIAPGAEIHLEEPVTGALNGSNSLQADIVQVNTLAADQIPANNTASTSFDIDPGNAGVALMLFLDDNPQQTSWRLLNQNGQTLATGGPYSEPFTAKAEYWCLQPGQCYTFRLYDSGGNGLNGSGSIVFGNTVLWTYTDSSFTDSLDVAFCPQLGCASLGLTADATPASASGASDGAISAVGSGGVAPYQFSLNGGPLQNSGLFSNLAPGTYQLGCQDANGCTASLTVVLTTSATQSVTGTGAKLEITPNPAQDIVRLRLPALTNALSVPAELYDSRGRYLQGTRMYRWDNDWRGGFDLDDYPSGTYWVKVSTSKGLRTGKIIKQ